jgi:phosphatidylglycerol lysyltransferase
MDAVNRFETRSTFLLWRLEYSLLLLVSLATLFYHWDQIRWIPFLILFWYIDLIGYVPGAIVYRLNGGKVPPFFYYLYNFTHNYVTAAVVAVLWGIFVGVEWALLALPIHLFGDRAIFGNSFKSIKVNYEGKPDQEFSQFSRLFDQKQPYYVAPAETINTAPKQSVDTPLSTSCSGLSLAKISDYLNQYANHPSSFLAANKATEHFTLPGIEGFIPYRDEGKCLFQICGVVAAEQDREKLLRAFVEKAKQDDKALCCVQIRNDQIPLYEQCGFSVNQMGLSYTLDLRAFKTSGTPFVSMRNKIKRAQKAGVVVHELGKDIPWSEQLQAELDTITQSWLSTKGNKPLLEFMVGELQPETQSYRRMFGAFLDNRLIGFVSYVPSHGSFSGWMHDISRREKEVPPGVMELINITAIDRFKTEDVAFLNFGLTPFCGIRPELDAAPSKSRFLSRLLELLEKYGQVVYPAVSQVAYKKKWQPLQETPEYVGFYSGFKLGHLYRLMKITRSI